MCWSPRSFSVTSSQLIKPKFHSGRRLTDVCLLFRQPWRKQPCARVRGVVDRLVSLFGCLVRVGQTVDAPSESALPLLLTLTVDFPLLHEANNEADQGRPCSSPSFTGGHRGDAG